jgi:hypothetical protein
MKYRHKHPLRRQRWLVVRHEGPELWAWSDTGTWLEVDHTFQSTDPYSPQHPTIYERRPRDPAALTGASDARAVQL